jgi:hypothetical protein
MNPALHDLIHKFEAADPPLLDAWEATALIESFGYTDRVSREDFRFRDARALAVHVYDRLAPSGGHSTAELSSLETGAWQRAARECRVFIEAFSSSYVYAIPWIALLILQYARPRALQLPPDLAGLLSLALMASLIATGGFVELIARRGQFYIGLQQPSLAYSAARQLVHAGCAATLVLGMSGLVLGLYVDVFPSPYLLVAGFYFVMLGPLWMLCKVLTLDKTYWRVPLVLAAGASAYASVTAIFGAPTLVAQIAATGTALTVAILMSWTRVVRPTVSGFECLRARRGVVFCSLAPIFWHGTAYFGFLFADRIAAGLAVPMASGIYFGIDADYQRGMDLALLSFFTTAALIEYLNHQYMRYWRKQAATTPEAQAQELQHRLSRRYLACTIVVVGAFSLLDSIVWRLFGEISPEMFTSSVRWSLVVGSAGYLVFSLGVFDAVLLFSANRPGFVTRPLLEALLVNVIVGGTLSHVVAPHYAGIGLVAGALVFVRGSRRAVTHMLRESDYAFYTA